jgi:hypothetical protein
MGKSGWLATSKNKGLFGVQTASRIRRYTGCMVFSNIYYYWLF